MPSADSPGAPPAPAPPAGFDELRLGVDGDGRSIHILGGREVPIGAVLEVWFEVENLVDHVRYQWSGSSTEPPWFETAAGAAIPLPPDMLFRWPAAPGALPGWDDSATAALMPFARRYIWWLSPEDAVRRPRRVIAQVMNLGTPDDAEALLERFGAAALRDALRHADAGWFEYGPRPTVERWVEWHRRLGLGEAPPLPQRDLPAK